MDTPAPGVTLDVKRAFGFRLSEYDRAFILRRCSGVSTIPRFDLAQLRRLADRGLITYEPDPGYRRLFGEPAMRIKTTAHGAACRAAIAKGGTW